MKLVKIQDRHMINKNNLPVWQQRLYDGKGYHIYLMYDETNSKGVKRHKLLATSHYYDPDKVTRIRKKNAILMRFKGLKEPTTVTNVRFQNDIKGRQFSENYPNMIDLGTLSSYQERRVRKFLNQDSKKHLNKVHKKGKGAK